MITTAGEQSRPANNCTGEDYVRTQEGGWNDDGGTDAARGASNLGRLKLRATARTRLRGR